MDPILVNTASPGRGTSRDKISTMVVTFLIMINDLSVSENSTNKMWKFADDSTISEVIPRTENSNLQDIVDQVANWSNNNKFQLNSGKCKKLRINFTKDPCRDEPVKVNDKHFEVVTSAKILGMTITDDLKWNVHVANILLKASKRLYLLKQLKRANVDTNSLNKFYCACIRSACPRIRLSGLSLRPS